MSNTYQFVLLDIHRLQEITALGLKLNPHLSVGFIENCFVEMFKFPTYFCFGMELNGNLLAISSGWITIRLYCGKQLEVDNVIVDPTVRSTGIGTLFFQHIEQWALAQNCQTIELNTYAQNSRSHKFYFNQGYQILGFHFQKHI